MITKLVDLVILTRHGPLVFTLIVLPIAVAVGLTAAYYGMPRMVWMYCDVLDVCQIFFDR
ncbi:MAG: hypothetical protein CMP81_06070 [Fulvimarina sp.]|nr:hypothetical protein [Fulvimarina sp.]